MVHNKNNHEPTFRWDLLLRYQLIEIIVLWEGRLTTRTLINAFGIARQQASRIINTYNTSVAPGNLIYDTHLKGYKPGTAFKPALTKGTVDEYLNLINTQRNLSTHFACEKIEQANTAVIFSPGRFVVPENIRPIIMAARDKFRLDIQYMSITSGVDEGRIITPHTLVYSGYRWHARAHCEKHGEYRDFVLSRISNIPERVTSSEHGIEGDVAWNTEITLRIIPDPRLTEFKQQIIALDFGMRNGVLEITTQAALASYYLQYLRIDHIPPEKQPEAQQLILENFDQIQHWLF